MLQWLRLYLDGEFNKFYHLQLVSNSITYNKTSPIMKKIIPVLSFLFALSAVNVFAQTSDTAELNVSANVISAISITEEAPLSFGSVIVGSQPIIDRDNSDGIGELSVSGSANEEFQVEIPATIELTNGTGSLEVATAFFFGEDLENSNDLINEQEVQLNGTGSLAIFFGGTLQALGGGDIPNDAAGEYNGTGNITVQYTSF